MNNPNDEAKSNSLWKGFVSDNQNKLNRPPVIDSDSQSSSTSSSRFKNHQNNKRSSNNQKLEKNSNNNNNYPVSLYSNQNKRYESFAKSIRQRNDTFYFVSFRRVSQIFLILKRSYFEIFLF